MKFIRDLIGRKQSGADDMPPRASDKLEDSYRDTIGSIADDAAPRQRGGDLPADVNAMLTNINAKTRPVEPPAPVAKEAEAPSAPAVNIWDMEGDDGSTALPDTAPVLPTPSPALASAAAARSSARSRRTKTRLIGFEKSDGDVVDLFNDAPKVVSTQRAKFPVGWIVVADGPGRGESFALMAGMNSIGRGEDQAVQLDFGDNAISRTNHAAIVYDTDGKEFLLGHGGKSNIVRLNDKPVISNETLTTGDVIRIGETVLRFVALCDKSFNWSDGATGEDEDVAIA
ncbi:MULTISPECIES: FHA domain-containing protein [unclassified Yoonia]|uniref:FHA domain-containing protein n=1 Tax=unclassified Yoonia TaxID=2629118 RepID=UPI002B003259|nr:MULTISPECIES: FHA domain-containing protein [unclassified Yoonia]